MKTVVCVALVAILAAACTDVAIDEPAVEPEAPEGPNGGRLLVDGEFALELLIFESGVPPEYHAWATVDGAPVDAREVDLVVTLARLGGAVDRIEFAPAGGFLRGNRTVAEPHSFDVRVTALHDGVRHEWEYAAYEGRTTIPAAIAAAAGIETAVAGPGVVEETLTLFGAVAADRTRVREVHARFPGVIRSVAKGIGDTVNAGDALAVIESNESLQRYTVTAPLAGVVTARNAEPGEQTAAGALFVVADFSSVWAQLDVFPRDRPRVRVGQSARVSGAGGASAAGTIDYIAPAADRETQSVTARIVLDNAADVWAPGQFVEALVTVAAAPVDLAVPLAAIQKYRDWDVVFARVGDTYEVRMLELGRRDAERVEVLGGLAPGTEYVVANSYLVKADIEKAGASHDH